MSLKAVVFCACVAIAALASASAKPSTSAKADGCDFDGQFVAVGGTVPAKDTCVKYTCVKPGEFSGVNCPSEAIPPNLQKKCHFEEHKERPYPECCPAVVCNE